MAVTKIKPIYVTDRSAVEYIVSDEKTSVEYIVNGEKTEKGILTDYFMCGENPAEAAKSFENTRANGSGRSKILAQHIMQSFEHGEVTPEQAFEIGRQLAERVLKGQYQYVLATHIDLPKTTFIKIRLTLRSPAMA